MVDFLHLLKIWNKLKLLISQKNEQILFKQGEIWWCQIGMNLGEESYGKGKLFTRPVLIFKKFTSRSFLGLPLTSQQKEGSWYVKIEFQNKKSAIMLNQARVLDSKRLTLRIAELKTDEFAKTKERFIEFYRSS